MSQKTADLPGIGPVILAKRKGAKNLRLTILPDGRIRVSMPTYVPYSAGISFAKARHDWILKHIVPISFQLRHGQRIGKSYRLNFNNHTSQPGAQARLGINSITVSSTLNPGHAVVQAKAKAAAERALKKEAQVLLGGRLKELSNKSGLTYSGFKVKKLSSRWGSCSSRGEITLNYFLVQLPWKLIDYVIIHELAHTMHHNHSREFWTLVKKLQPNAQQLKKEIKTYRPIIMAQ